MLPPPQSMQRLFVLAVLATAAAPALLAMAPPLAVLANVAAPTIVAADNYCVDDRAKL
jgi:hypothetical protein